MIRAIVVGDGSSKPPDNIPTNLGVTVQSPSSDFSVLRGAPLAVSAKVTDNLGNIITGASLVKATFTNGDDDLVLLDDGSHSDGAAGDGVFANTWTPQTTAQGYTETACTITVIAHHGTLSQGSAKVSGIIMLHDAIGIIKLYMESRTFKSTFYTDVAILDELYDYVEDILDKSGIIESSYWYVGVPLSSNDYYIKYDDNKWYNYFIEERSWADDMQTREVDFGHGFTALQVASSAVAIAGSGGILGTAGTSTLGSAALTGLTAASNLMTIGNDALLVTQGIAVETHNYGLYNDISTIVDNEDLCDIQSTVDTLGNANTGIDLAKMYAGYVTLRDMQAAFGDEWVRDALSHAGDPGFLTRAAKEAHDELYNTNVVVSAVNTLLGLFDAADTTFTNTIGMEFVLIPAGKFDMGSPSDEEGRWSGEGPVHHVTIEDPFYMGKSEVTQQQWRAVMGDNPSFFSGDNDLPVETVSWDDVQSFITKLNDKEGTDKYRLPSEAEWEYACRAGTTTRYSFGDSESEHKNLNDLTLI